MAKYDLALDANGDLYIGANGDFAIITSVRQAIQIRLRWIRNEWAFNPELGTPYIEDIFGKKPNTAYIERAIKDQVLAVDGVLGVSKMEIEIDHKSRVLHCSFVASTRQEDIEMEVSMNGQGIWSN